MQVILDGHRMLNRTDAHGHLKQQLQLPEYYGCNLDGLYDLLTERKETTQICLQHSEQMLAGLGMYGRRLLDTIFDAAEKNPRIAVMIE